MTHESRHNRDKVEWDQEQEDSAQIRIAKQMTAPVSLELQAEYNANPAAYWDDFYANVKGPLHRFFHGKLADPLFSRSFL